MKRVEEYILYSEHTMQLNIRGGESEKGELESTDCCLGNRWKSKDVISWQTKW